MGHLPLTPKSVGLQVQNGKLITSAGEQEVSGRQPATQIHLMNMESCEHAFGQNYVVPDAPKSVRHVTCTYLVAAKIPYVCGLALTALLQGSLVGLLPRPRRLPLSCSLTVPHTSPSSPLSPLTISTYPSGNRIRLNAFLSLSTVNCTRNAFIIELSVPS